MKLRTKVGKGIRFLFRGVVYSIGLFITVFIIASSYETASGNDVPFLGAVQRASLQTVAPTLDKQTITQLTDREREGNFGRPETMRVVIDKKPVKVVIAPGFRNNGQWLVRANTSHLLYTSDAKAGNAGDMLIYMKQSWRTIANPADITRNSNIFIDTNQNWRYMFRVQDIQTVASDAQMLIPEAKSTQLMIVINEPNSSRSVIIRGQFVSLMNVGQL